MKKILSVILSTALVVSLMAPAAYAFEDAMNEPVEIVENEEIEENLIEKENTSDDDVFSAPTGADYVTEELGKGTITVQKSTGQIVDVSGVRETTIVPERVGGVTVTSIYTNVSAESEIESAFANSPNITSLKLPGTIKTIPQRAFYYNDALKELTLSQGVEAIEEYIGADNLESISIPKSVKSISPLFSNSMNLELDIDTNSEYYVMDGGVLYTADRRTVVCAPEKVSMNSVLTLHSRARTIGESAFQGRKNLFTLNIQQGLRLVEKNAFLGCVDLFSIEIPEGVTRVGDHAFQGCESLTRAYIPTTATSIGIGMFDGCKSLTAATIPSTLVKIPERMFKDTAISEVPNFSKLSSIGDRAFYGCKSLSQNLAFPSSLESIGIEAFANCTKLANVSFPSNVQIMEKAFAGSSISGQILFPGTTKFSGVDHFANCKFIEEVTFGSGIVYLGRTSFRNCEKLRFATIPVTVKNMGDAFTYGIDDTFTIYGLSGSDAHRYAVENIYGFISQGKAPMRFDDIDDHWGKEDIEWTYYRGLFGGTTDVKFSPDVQMTRAMFVAVLYRNAQERPTTESKMTDVPDDAYYKNAVDWAVENKIVTGTSPTTFSPAKSITRQELCAMLYRYAIHVGADVDVYDDIYDDTEAGRPAGLDKFKDGSEVSKYAEEAVVWAIYKDIIRGSNGNINPKGNAKRAEVAAIMHRFVDFYEKQKI